ncbi:protein of unknown function DUF418 (plasmid) [Gemmatirosa kalamazoonensis]|uniref:DUF418 domain-containing protein n=1 Tax=Gemmatirosa kalamazoonensis TaxID=861299 RepID=W0RQ97_9BACT|nr:DUF418 domain-containing protein [Gemmatirosa kalamazoonensis]AHG92515.1 protein of unknown function DUF418 [Gemmatirosa kalamazoonensis]
MTTAAPPTIGVVPSAAMDARPDAGTSAAPLGAGGRIAPIDVLRGVALLGILLMNVQSYGLPSAAYLNPTAYGGLAGADWWLWAVGRVLVDQKMYGLFAMLFGAGVVLMTERVESRGRRPAALHVRRMAWLLVFGMLHAWLLWSGDILYTYALCGMAAYAFRRKAPRTLFVVGGVFLVVGALIWLGAGFSMRFWPPATVAGFEQDMWRPTAAQLAREIATYRDGGWLAQTSSRVDDAIAMETYIFFFFVAWKTLGLMLVGMGLLKAHVLDASRPRAFYLRMLAVGAAVGVALNAWGIREDARHGWSVRYSFFFGDQWNYWGAACTSFAWLALVMLLCRSSLAARTGPLAAVGRTAFTNYILQTVLCTTLFYGYGFGLFAKLDRVQLLGVVAAVWAVQLALASWWLARFRFGPLEWLWRSLTYWRRQPMRRVAA